MIWLSSQVRDSIATGISLVDPLLGGGGVGVVDSLLSSPGVTHEVSTYASTFSQSEPWHNSSVTVTAETHSVIKISYVGPIFEPEMLDSHFN